MAAGAGAVVAAGSAGYAGTVAVLGLLTACILLLMGVARLGFLADLISQPVLAGFLSGVGVSLVIGKAPRDARHRGVRHDVGQGSSPP